MKSLTQADCDRIAYRLNTRPRKRLGFKTPQELYYGKDSSLHLLLEAKRIFLILIFNEQISLSVYSEYVCSVFHYQ
jgi:hypothetical protein